jgi:hypothetical protein
VDALAATISFRKTVFTSAKDAVKSLIAATAVCESTGLINTKMNAPSYTSLKNYITMP